MDEHICPKCGISMKKYAVSHGAFPVCVSGYQDVTQKHMVRADTVQRDIDLDRRSWLSAWVCPKCGYTELQTERPHDLEPPQDGDNGG